MTADRGHPAAIVFDADGLLIDTEPAWIAARAALYARHGSRFGPGEQHETLGTGVYGTAQILSERIGRPARAAELTDELAALLIAQIEREPVRPLAGAVALVGELSGRVPLAVASNSPRALLEQTLESSGLAGLFDLVIGADEVDRPKPAPDLYAAAVSRLGALPADSVALEDSPAGVRSARAAGLYVIGIPASPAVALEADETALSLADPALRPTLGLHATRTGQS